jgi:uncharacterized protein (TIGR03435 family)
MNDAQRKAAFALVRKRLQRLLAERFQLVVNTETKQLPAYALVLAKNGHKLKPNTAPDGAIQGMATGRVRPKRSALPCSPRFRSSSDSS